MQGMIQRVIFGLWDVFFMKCVHWCHHLEQMICKAFIRRSLKENIQEFQNILAKKWQQL